MTKRPIISLIGGVVLPETVDSKPVLESEAHSHKVERLGFAVKTLNSALRDLGLHERVVLYAFSPDEAGFDEDGMDATIRIMLWRQSPNTPQGGLE